jgi:hypothetical protein
MTEAPVVYRYFRNLIGETFGLDFREKKARQPPKAAAYEKLQGMTEEAI